MGETSADTGFNGFETITPKHDYKEGAFAVFVVQADDDRMRRLRETLTIPAVPAANGASKSPDLILVGGETTLLVGTIRKILSYHFSRVTDARTLEALARQKGW